MSRNTLMLALVLSLATPFYATTLTQVIDQPTFAAALTNLQQVDFDITGSSQDYSVSGLFIGDAAFMNIGGSTMDDLYIANYAPLSMGFGGVLAMPFGSPAYLLINFASPVSGVGFLAKGWDATAFTFSVAGSDAVVIANLPNVTSSPQWIGVTSDTPFSSISISTSANRGFMDKFQYGTVTAAEAPPEDTPELATMLMIGFGLLSLRGIRRFSFARAA